MSEDGNARLAREAQEAWNARDLDRYLALLSRDCLVETCWEGAALGHDAVRSAVQRYLGMFLDLTFETEKVVATDDMAVVRWRAVGIPRARMADSIPAVQVAGCSVAGLKDGQIVRLWYYWDREELLRAVRRRPQITQPSAA